MFLERDMPTLTNFLHYRIIDVSSLKELARRWHPRAYFNSPKKAGGHRALADIAESIDELRYYRAALFPGDGEPASVDAQAHAERIAADSTLAKLECSVTPTFRLDVIAPPLLNPRNRRQVAEPASWPAEHAVVTAPQDSCQKVCTLVNRGHAAMVGVAQLVEHRLWSEGRGFKSVTHWSPASH